jgi:hypothetical protein
MLPRGFFFHRAQFFAAKISRLAKNFVLVSRSVTSSFASANLAGSRGTCSAPDFPLSGFRNTGLRKKDQLEKVEIKQVF